MVELGRIRTGQRVLNKAGTTLIPSKLDSFRFTSPAEHLIKAIAALYGGEVKPFTGEGVVGRQFEVITDVSSIPVYLTRQKIDPFYEQWKGGVCVRRCDGERDLIHGNPCDCARTDEGLPSGCKPTTRINMMLAEVPGIGQWRLESHGIYAAMELSQLAFLVEKAPAPIPARLILEARQRKFFSVKKGKVEVRDYFVPVVMVDAVTSRDVVMGGDAMSQALRMAAGAQELESPPSAPALPAAPAPQPKPKPVDPAMIERAMARIAAASTMEELADIQKRIQSIGSPESLVAAWKERFKVVGMAALEGPAQAEADIVVEAVLERVRTASVAEMDALWDEIEAMGLPDLVARAWGARRDQIAVELLERIPNAAREALDVMREAIERLGSPESLVGAWKTRYEHLAAEDARLAREAAAAAEGTPRDRTPADGFEAAWEGEEASATQGAAPAAAPEPPSEQEMAARKAAMMTLLGEAGTRGMKMTAVNDMLFKRYGRVATEVSAAELAQVTAELAGAPR